MVFFYVAIVYLILFPFMQQQLYFVYSIPTPRWGNSCNIVSGSLICIGGEQLNSKISNEIYKLDLYNSWNTSNPLWELLQMNSSITYPNAFFSANNHYQSIFIFGGLKTNQPISQQSALAYDMLNKYWYDLPINDSVQLQRKQHTATLDHQDNIWIWGGVSDISTYNKQEVIYHNTWISININTLTYNTPNIFGNNPSPRIDHTATLISNQEILIMGGVIFSKNVTDPSGSLTLLPVSMNQFDIFNTNTGSWRNEIASGNIPAARCGFTAVLHEVQNSKNIVIFGGSTGDNKHLLNDIFVLQLHNMEWESKIILGLPPKPRKYHQANLIDNLMIVTFGLDEEVVGYNDVNILNISKWQWISTYSPNMDWLSNNSISTGDSNNSNQNGSDDLKLNTGIIAGIISVSAVSVSVGAIFFLRGVFKQKKKNQDHNQGQNQDKDISLYKLNCVNSHQTMVNPSNNDIVKSNNHIIYSHNITSSNVFHKPNEYDYPENQAA
ncbi:unnamed protein product [Cunninghamella blakesleeana]